MIQTITTQKQYAARQRMLQDSDSKKLGQSLDQDVCSCLLLGVDIQADHILAVLLSGCNVHINGREGRWDQGCCRHFNRDVDGASCNWVGHCLHDDLSGTKRKLASDVGGCISLTA